MAEPLNVSGAPLGSMTLHEVEPGTVVEFNGRRHIVDDGHAVVQDHHLYVTPAILERIRAKTTGGEHG